MTDARLTARAPRTSARSLASALGALGLAAALAGCMADAGAPPRAVAPPPPPLADPAPSDAAPSDAAPSAQAIPEHIQRALADAARPATDAARDADRKAADMLVFAGIRPGQRVADLIPGGGYFTRLFAKAVGPEGLVYAVAPPSPPNSNRPSVDAVVADPAYANVRLVPLAGAFAVPEPVDVIFTAQNYHDLHLARLKVDVPAMNKALFDALKPGGVLVVVDHSALAGAPIETADTLHRIDEAVVKREVTAAGFVLDAESEVLRNPADVRTQGVFDPAIRGRTDQFVLRFRKPN